MRFALLALVLLAAPGCKNVAVYQAPIARFRLSTTLVIESTKLYLTALNKTERDHYIERSLAERKRIDLVRMREVQVFSADAIGARLRALTALENYAELLYQLSSTKAPADLQARAGDLGKSVKDLGEDIARLTGEKDAAFQNAAGATFSVIGSLLNRIAAGAQLQAIQSAIQTGAGPVNQMIEAIKNDARIAYTQKRSALSGAREAATKDYNTELAKGAAANPEILRGLAREISETEDRWEAFGTANPVLGLTAMQEANDALAKLAAAPRPSPGEIGAFQSAIDAFETTALHVSKAVLEVAK